MLQNEPYPSAVPAVQSRNDFRYPGLLERAGLAHELGNLIQVASSAMNIVSRNSNIQTNADLEPVLSGARTSLDRAGLLVRQTLLREKTADEEFDPIEVGQYLTDVARVVLHTWPPEIRVRLSLQPDLPAVRCDPLALHNAILNLALNARAAMPDGGEIDITARTTAADNGSASIQISVSDTGIGMNEDTAKRA